MVSHFQVLNIEGEFQHAFSFLFCGFCFIAPSKCYSRIDSSAIFWFASRKYFGLFFGFNDDSLKLWVLLSFFAKALCSICSFVVFKYQCSSQKHGDFLILKLFTSAWVFIAGDDILLEFPIYSNTECCRISSKSFVITVDNESLFFKFHNDEGRFREKYAFVEVHRNCFQTSVTLPQLLLKSNQGKVLRCFLYEPKTRQLCNISSFTAICRSNKICYKTLLELTRIKEQY